VTSHAAAYSSGQEIADSRLATGSVSGTTG
jgi:hypothetical protein